MTETPDTQAIGPEADPERWRDKPLCVPPTGNPRVFGPGRGRPVDRALIVLGGTVVALCLLWLIRLEGGYELSPGLLPRTGADMALYLVLALIMGATLYLAATYPPEQIILRVDDHGLTLRSLRPYDRARTFMAFDLLETVAIRRKYKSTDYLVQIEMRQGARWRSCTFAARSATGTKGPEIAAEIARRAGAAGMIVTPPEPPRYRRSRMLWTFTPPVEDEARRRERIADAS